MNPTTSKDPREQRRDEPRKDEPRRDEPRPEDRSKQPVDAPADKRSPNQQEPPTDNERSRGDERNEKIRRSNQAGDQDVDGPVDTEEGKSGPDGVA